MKMKKFLAMALCLLTGVASVGCQAPVQEKDSTVSLMGFESVRELLSIYVKNIGEIGLCKEEGMVTQGNASMRISYMYDVKETEYAKDMQIAMMPGNKYFSKQKYLDVEYLAMDVYNANESPYQMAVQVNAEELGGAIVLETYELAPGWNEIYTYVDRAAFEFASNGSMSYYSLIFRGQKGESPEFFVDNFRCYTTEEEYEKYAFDYEKEIWHDFSHRAETTILGVMGTPESVFSKPKLSLNYDPKFIATGKSSLRADFFTKRDGSMDVTAFRTKNYFLPDFNNYLGEENWYIFFDVYNAYDYDITLQVIVISDYNDESYGVSVTIPANSWSNPEECRIYLNDLEEAYTGVGVNAMTVSYFFKGITTAGSVYLDAVGIRK